jgi:hypothetical protein
VQLRQYCVTVMDHWTPMRYFWTLKRAKAFREKHIGCAYLFKWVDGRFQQMERYEDRLVRAC